MGIPKSFKASHAMLPRSVFVLLAVSEECREDVYKTIDLGLLIEEAFEREEGKVVAVELTEEQQRAVAQATPPRVVDPTTNIAYVLVRADVYERLRTVLGDDFHVPDAYPALDRAFAEGWADPKMDDYDHYDDFKR